MSARLFIASLLLVASANLMADVPGYRLWIQSAMRGDFLTLIPHIAAPSPVTLRYEIVSTKQGKSGRSTTAQSGQVIASGTGSRLSTLSISVKPDDRYIVSVKVFDGQNVVAEKTLTYPE